MVFALTGIILDGFNVVLATPRQCNRGRFLFALFCPLSRVRRSGGGNPDFISRLIVPAQDKPGKAVARYPEGVVACPGRVDVTLDSLTKIVPRLPRRLEARQVFHTVWMRRK